MSEVEQPTTTLVVPCCNEARRLDVHAFHAFIGANASSRFVLVDDGSRDDTLSVLREIQSRAPARISVVRLTVNRGKAEAVRAGMREALESGSQFVGYWDADLATPLDASLTFARLLRERPMLELVVGSRVMMLGRSIERRALRHYVGRIFATAASAVLALPIYDTQCGAKLFRVTPRLRQVLADRFLSTWAFDVEILARFGSLAGPYSAKALLDIVYEVPLDRWADVGESKVRARDFFRAMIDLGRIRRVYTTPRAKRSRMALPDVAVDQP